MNILVTGHRGYIGPVLLQQLYSAGYRNLTGLDSNLYNRALNGHPAQAIRQVNRDIRDITAGDLHGHDAIIHLAGLSNDPLGNLDEKLTYEINYDASVRLANLARKSGVQRFIFASTCSVYGHSNGNSVDESAETIPVTAYARSKLLAERAISELADDSFCPVFLRNATVYGASPGMRFDLVVNNLVASAYINNEVLLRSDGTAWRPLVHVNDVCKAMILMLSAPRDNIFNSVFNVGSNEQNYQVISIAHYIKESKMASKIRFADDANCDRRTYNVNFDKIRKSFPNFNNRMSVYKGIEEVFTYLGNRQLLPGDIFGPEYIRIDYLRKMLAEQKLSKDLRWA